MQLEIISEFVSHNSITAVWPLQVKGEMEDVIVRTSLGLVRGQRSVTDKGTSYVSFLGMPYACPPVGALRFQPPVPAKPWSGIREAVHEGPPCCQLDEFTGGFSGQEDCLYLNVFTPEVHSEGKSLKAVMFWIHGGGFTIGSSKIDQTSPDFFLDNDIVFVSSNYRLGALGFLNLPRAGVTGNMGIKDQMLALKWVQQNIRAFGGNKDNVTIFGQSCGGASVHIHMLSPLSAGLFHKSVAESGTALCSFVLLENVEENARILGQALGATGRDEDVYSALAEAEPQRLCELTRDAFQSEQVLTPFVMAFTPVKDGQVIPGEPALLVRKGLYRHVPFLVGVTSHEFMGAIKGKVYLDNRIETYASKIFLPREALDLGDDRRQEMLSRLKQFYLTHDTWSKDPLAFINVISDASVVYPTLRTARLHAENGDPVFLYNFGYSGSLNILKLRLKLENIPGASHCDELGYLFKIQQLPAPPKGSKDERIRLELVERWCNFAKTGKPAACNCNIEWPEFTSDDPVFLNISDEVLVKRYMEKERMDLWDALFTSFCLE